MTNGRDRLPSAAIAPTTIRIPPELRDALQREANINGKTLSMEIVERLRRSLDDAELPPVLRTGDTPASVYPAGENPRQRPVSDAHRMLLALFDAMGPDKQLALLTVLKR